MLKRTQIGKSISDLQKAFTKTLMTLAFKMHTGNVNTYYRISLVLFRVIHIVSEVSWKAQNQQMAQCY